MAHNLCSGGYRIIILNSLYYFTALVKSAITYYLKHNTLQNYIPASYNDIYYRSPYLPIHLAAVATATAVGLTVQIDV